MQMTLYSLELTYDQDQHIAFNGCYKAISKRRFPESEIIGYPDERPTQP